MTHLNIQTVHASLTALPVAIVFTRKLLQNHKTPVAVESVSPDIAMKSIERRANTLTETLKGIVGYDHAGLNE